MTQEEIRDRARRYARVTESDKTDTEVNDLIADMHIEMVRDVYGLTKSAFLSLVEAFTIETNFRVNITITGGSNALSATDVQVSASALSRATGTAVASAFQTAIRAAGASSATVTWTDYYFTLDAIDSTSITISKISDDVNYVDAAEKIFGVTGTQTDTEFTGEFPEDCTWETAVPSDFLRMLRVEWDGNPLEVLPLDASLSPRGYGNFPRYYAVWDEYIRLVPVPNVIKPFYVEYKAVPTDSHFTSEGIEPDFPSRFHYGLVYRTASELLSMNHEADLALFYERRYRKVRNEFRQYESGMNVKLAPPDKGYPVFDNSTISTTAAD